MDVEQTRQGFAMFMPMGGAGPDVAKTEDRTIPGPAGEIPIRIYWPSGDANRPVIVFFHGGGWTIGTIQTHDSVAKQLCVGADAIVVNVEYRLAPENKFPAAADDAFAAVQWVAAHAGEIGGDASRVAVAGDSAGGNLSAVTALRARDEGGPPLVFQLLVYPVTDSRMDTESYVENASGYFLTAETMRNFWGSYLASPAEATNPYASPMHAEDLSGLPPALVITAGYDPLRDEGEAYATRLRDAGVDAKASRYEGSIHVFFGLTNLFAASDRAMKEACDALRGAFGNA
jgi:acetyl esterase